jgi:hypothetical protein
LKRHLFLLEKRSFYLHRGRIIKAAFVDHSQKAPIASLFTTRVLVISASH